MSKSNYEVSKEDNTFLEKIELGKFPVDEFSHKAHLRLAYIYLIQHQNVNDAVSSMRCALLGLLKQANIDPDEKYHETLTQAWVMAVQHFISKTKHASSADEFIAQHPEMLDSGIMTTHYSANLLFSDGARKSFIEPDISPIPSVNSKKLFK